MKAAYVALLTLSIPFAVFSTVYGLKMGELRVSSWDAPDTAYDEAGRRQDDAHLIVTAGSVVYYLVAVAICVVGIVFSRGIGWRIALAVGAVAGLVMGAWSLMLSRAISFDEAFPAWIAAAVVFVVLGIIGLVRSGSRPAPHRSPTTGNS